MSAFGDPLRRVYRGAPHDPVSKIKPGFSVVHIVLKMLTSFTPGEFGIGWHVLGPALSESRGVCGTASLRVIDDAQRKGCLAFPFRRKPCAPPSREGVVLEVFHFLGERPLPVRLLVLVFEMLGWAHLQFFTSDRWLSAIFARTMSKCIVARMTCRRPSHVAVTAQAAQSVWLIRTPRCVTT